jgi:hypothetical protein
LSNWLAETQGHETRETGAGKRHETHEKERRKKENRFRDFRAGFRELRGDVF